MGAVLGGGLGGALLGSILGLITVAAWKEFLSGHLDWSLDELLALTSGMAVPLALLLIGCSRCTAVDVQENGLVIRTCLFRWFFVPWSDVRGLWGGWIFSPMDPWLGQRSYILIARGLTPLHEGLVKGPEGWEWSRCFMITSDGQGYSDVVHVIEQHVKGKQVVAE